MLKLGVNIDHVATVRQARLGVYPDPIEAAIICEEVGAYGITAHLREDRRHIIDSDIFRLREAVSRLNMEMAITDEMVKIALKVKPDIVCLVPEKREELTTEGGLDLIGSSLQLEKIIPQLQAAKIEVSLFIDPDQEQIAKAAALGVECIELHTGQLAEAETEEDRNLELLRLIKAAIQAHHLGIIVNAGHGIDYKNIDLVKQIPHLHELNIGHSIVGRAIFVGMKSAVEEMLDLMQDYRW